jgi:hypothetical protein
VTDHTEEPAEAEVIAEAAADRRGIRRFGRLDPGVATLVAAALALVGTIVTAVVRDSGGGSSGPEAGQVVVDTTVASSSTLANAAQANTSAPTSTAATPTTAEEPPTSPATSAVTTTSLPPAPIVQVMSAVPADQRQAVNSASESILALANQLPLIVHDEFANNDYAWPETQETYTGGIECSWAIEHNSYETLIHTADGGAWCRNGLSKVASDFVLTVDASLRDASNSDVGLQFRVTPDRSSYYELDYNPQTQTLSLSFVNPEGSAQVIPPTYVADIHRTASNTITLLTLGSSMAVYVNDSLAALVSNETRLTAAGTIAVRLQLNEAHEDEQLSLTRYELRGH